MDVDIAPVPTAYDEYRARLRAFLAENRPVLAWSPRAGMRVPDAADDVELLRTYVRRIYDAGYRLDRFATELGDPHEQRILAQELGAVGVPYILGNPLAAGALKHFGSEEQQERFLPPMARGDHIWTQLFSEPDAGSDLTSLQTRAHRVGDEFVVVGQKVWSTWAQWSDFGYLLARTEPVAGAAGITAFVLDMHAPGVDVRPLREITGTTDFNEVFLDEVRVPATNMIGAPGDGWRVAGASLVEERAGVGGGGSGAGSTQALVALARRSRRAGRPAIDDGAVRQRIGGLAARARIHRHLGQRMATRAQKGHATPADAPITKVWFGELNLEICEAALSFQGVQSLAVEGDKLAVEDGRWQDAFLYARAWTIAGGSNEIMRNVIAERGLGLPREPRGHS